MYSAFFQANRVFYKVALVPLGDYVFFLAQFTTFGASKIRSQVILNEFKWNRGFWSFSRSSLLLGVLDSHRAVHLRVAFFRIRLRLLERLPP